MNIRPPSRPGRSAFTLIELLVAVTVLTLIIVGLYAMFNQTQRAWRGSVTQVDVQEGARAAMEMMARELTVTTPSRLTNFTNFYLANAQSTAGRAVMTNAADQFDTNRPVLRDFWFLSRGTNGSWSGTGYFVDMVAATAADTNLLRAGIGTLYKQTNLATRLTGSNLVDRFFDPAETNRFQRVLDGVVHLQLIPFDQRGNNLGASLPASTETDKVSASYELELAILEPHILDQVRALPSLAAMTNFLSHQLGRVHIFRQKIPVPSAER